MKVLITGATGLVGKAIVAQCKTNGISVHYLSTSKEKIESTENYQGFYWNPAKQEIDVACFNGVDAIINLAGSPISKSWTKAYKQTILNSRLESLQLLKSTIKNENIEIKQLISASAIGIYPDSIINYYEEKTTAISLGFLGEVAESWEKAADEFSDLGVIVTKIRIGLVMDSNEGALPQMVKPIKLGLGAAFGSGLQWQSWIHKKDLARIFVHTLEHKLEGVFNGVAPNPVTNLELTKAIAKTVNKPLWLPNIPRFVMKLVLGEMHVLLFESQRVCAKKIIDSGFEYRFVNLKPALEDLLE
ncbi:TIGR01777 family oxidoreductase [Xanthomarina sp. F2636L]|uniref:TIGR01777 family oxidoreductase n=1 Tax=Xanthomarina sp. F2636L TaxID=2996018 RepID=UPI00225DD9BB|nr:TIGR01777 family oxidoreductase [Xanthomarina sp. F2636L]MCX7550520.1 TIGR01777 family oxidoreductase [Xanthomarina sp. F2636L]